MKKIFWIAILFTIMAPLTYTFADNVDKWDCEKITQIQISINNIESKNGDIWEKVRTNILDESTTKVAIKNLIAACCENWIITENDKCGSKPNYHYPNSVYILDHILDIYLRRLDANSEQIYEEISPDELWKERRNFATKYGNDPKWISPVEINQIYANFRANTQQLNQNRNEDITKTITNSWKNSLTWLINQYDNRTLYDKYNLSCDLVQYISYLINVNEELTTPLIQHFSQSEYNKCKTMIKNRISNENKYTFIIQKQLSNKLLWNNIYTYLNDVFLGNKLFKLQQIFFEAQSTLSEINRNIKELTNQCS